MSSTTQKRVGCEGCCCSCFYFSCIPLCLCTNYCGLPSKFPITSIMLLNRSPALCSAIINHSLLAIENTLFPQLLSFHHHRPWSELSALGLLVHDSLYNPRGLYIPILQKKGDYTPATNPSPTSISTLLFHLLSTVSSNLHIFLCLFYLSTYPDICLSFPSILQLKVELHILL